MAKHMETGKKGETLAAGWLSANGYTLLYRNWRFRKCEIDIVALKNGKLHLIEVKTSTNLHFGFPEERIRKKKAMQIMQAGAYFLECYPDWEQVQYDILSLLLLPGQGVSYFLIEDVFWNWPD